MDAITPAKAEHDPLARFRWKARVLVVLAADPESPELAEQKRQFESLKAAQPNVNSSWSNPCGFARGEGVAHLARP